RAHVCVSARAPLSSACLPPPANGGPSASPSGDTAISFPAMPPRFGVTFRARRALAALAALLVMLLAAACSSAAFDPSGPCSGDGRAAGAYPDLEALVPRSLDGRPPATVDSGRNSHAATRSTLAGDRVQETA